MFWLLSIISLSASDLVESSAGVWTLDASNLSEALSSQNGILIEFYSPNCGHCKTLAPEILMAGEFLKSEGLYLGQINTLENDDLSEKYRINSIPSFFYFQNGLAIRFHGHFQSAQDIISWIGARRKFPLRMVENEIDILAVKSVKMGAIYVGAAEDPLRDQFDRACTSMTDIVFAVRNSPEELLEANYTSPIVVFYSNLQVNTFVLTESYSDLVQFLETHRPPKVYEWNEHTMDLIMTHKTPALVLLVDSDKAKDYLGLLEALSEKYSQQLQILFTHADLADNSTDGIRGALGFSREAQPRAVIVKKDEKILKYLADGLRAEELEEFIEKWRMGEVRPFFRSEPVEEPPRYERKVRKIVGKNFREVVEDESKDVAVVFYKEGNQESITLMALVERVAFEMKKVTDLEFCKMEVERNEVEGLQLNGIPAFTVYSKNNKKGYQFNNYGSKYTLMHFVRDHTRRI